MNNFELKNLSELMADFPSDIKSADEAYAVLQLRYRIPEENIDLIARHYYSILEQDKENLARANRFNSINHLVKSIHKYLFEGVLSNNGEFRKTSDPFEGMIGFGGVSKTKSHQMKFTGSGPENIIKDLEVAYGFLFRRLDPVADAVEFYRKFVKVHPFYDANGRTAR